MSASLDRAMILLRQSRPELAEREFRAALADDPDDPVAHAFLALCLVELKRLPEATDEAREAISLGPDLPLAHYASAVVALSREHHKEAEGAIREAIRLDPETAEFFGLLANVHYQQRRWKDALEAAEQGLALDPEDVHCNNFRAMALVKLGRGDEAGETLDATLARAPEDALTHANRGWTLLHQGRHREALDHFREALRLEPNLEWARAGIVEALKARNPVYRVMLRYFLWMGRLSSRNQWLVLLGFIFGRRIVAWIGEAVPAIRPFTGLLLVLIFGFLVLTWIAMPLFNLLLRVDRFGRLALSREQVVASNWLGAGVLAVLLGFAAWAATGGAVTWIFGAFFFLLLVPLSGTFNCSEGWPRVVMACVTAGLLFVGPVAVLGLHLRPEGTREAEFFEGLLPYFLPGVVLSTWAGVFLAQVRVRK